MSRWIKFSCVAHGVLIGCWLVAPPPGLPGLGPLSVLTRKEEVPLRASLTAHFPGGLECTEAPCPREPDDTRWYRLVQESEITVAAEAAELRRRTEPDPPLVPIEPGRGNLSPARRTAVWEPALIYVEAAADVSWGQVMASLDELQGAAGDRARLVLVREH